jgi:putative membrane protein
MIRGLVAFGARLALSALVLWGAVTFVSPDNPANTFRRAALISEVLSIAYYVTLAKFLWFLLLPWLVYVAIWMGTVMSSYGLGLFQALLVAVGMTVLSWLVELVLGVKTFRKG